MRVELWNWRRGYRLAGGNEAASGVFSRSKSGWSRPGSETQFCSLAARPDLTVLIGCGSGRFLREKRDILMSVYLLALVRRWISRKD